MGLLSLLVVGKGYGTDARQLDRERLPEAAAVAREVEAVVRGIEDEVGIVGDCDRAAGREAPARLAPRSAGVVGDHHRRARVDDCDQRRAGLGRRHHPRERDGRRRPGLELARLGAGDLLLVQVDLVQAVLGLDQCDHGALPARSMETRAEARRAALGGESPPARAARYAAAKASPDPVGSGSPWTRRAGTSSASPSASTIAPREPRVTITSGTPRRRSARSSRPSTSTCASSSASLRIDTW